MRSCFRERVQLFAPHLTLPGLASAANILVPSGAVIPAHENIQFIYEQKFTEKNLDDGFELEPTQPDPQPAQLMLLTGPFLGGLGRDFLHAVGRKPAHLTAGAALPEAPLSDAQNWGGGIKNLIQTVKFKI